MKSGDTIYSKELGNGVSEIITYWSPYISHVEMVYLEKVSLNITFPRPKFRKIEDIFNGKNRVIIIRPLFNFDLDAYERLVYRIYRDCKYDLFTSFLGHIFGKNWQSKRKRVNCSTGWLKVWQELGYFKAVNAERFKPRDAYMLMMGMVEAGKAEIVFQKDRAVIEDYAKLMEV